jgi:hypothetical protein
LALSDAIYAERLAGALRGSEAFCTSRTYVTGDGLGDYVSARAKKICGDLSGSDADVQWAIDYVAKRWRGVDAGQKPVRVVSLLVAHAKRLLRSQGREMVLKVDRATPGREILLWRFVSLALPPGILIAAATPSGSLPAASVRLLHPSIAPDGPVAQQHVHHAAMVSFERLWAGLRWRVLSDMSGFMVSMRERRAFCPGIHRGFCIGGRGSRERDVAKKFPFMRAKHLSEWGEVIRQAFIARGILERHAGHRRSLSDCVFGGCAATQAEVRDLLDGRSRRYLQADRAYPWPDELLRLAREQRRVPVRNRHAHPSSKFIGRLEADEARLLARAFRYLGATEGESLDPQYEKLFLQYLRVKSAVFGLLVHPPGERGLKNFLDHFEQIKVYAPDAESAIPSPPEEPGLDVRATEYRLAPDAWFEACRRPEIEHPRVYGKAPDTAWLIHFKREAAGDGIPLRSDAVRRMESEAHQIASALDADPIRLRLLRGIDICGVEEVQPCWVVADTLRTLRRRSQEIAARDPRLRLEPLRLTLHAGEDFQWLTSGVRAIAEPFIWNLIERGDRIGHGIALTIDPLKWWARRSRDVVTVKRFDRLLDLAFLAEYVEHPTRDQVEWLRHSITEIVKDLRLDRDVASKPSVTIDIDTVETAKRLWRTLGTRRARTLMDTATWTDETRRHEKWIHRYLWTPSIQKLADDDVPMLLEDDRKGLSIPSDRNERDLLIEARNRLIREVARWQICIEANPSSNLIVGGLDGMSAQDHLHARATQIMRSPDKETLTWTISTDDPITFSTTLADEYAYAWAGMVLREENSIDPSYARAVLDEAAATSMRTRFTIPSDEAGTNRKGQRPTRSRRD